LEAVGPLFQVMTAEQAAAWWTAGDDGSLPPGLALWEELSLLIDVPQAQRVDLTVQMMRGDLLYLRGFAQLRAGRLDEAIASWNAIDGDLAPLKELFNNCGSALAEHGRTQAALEFYRRALEEEPRYLLAWRNLAVVHRTRGDWSSAIAALRELLAIDPRHREARLELAHLLDQEERPVEALAEYEALAVADPDDAEPWAAAGRLMHRRGDLRKAEDAFREALRIDPRRSDVAQALDRPQRGLDLLAADGPQLADHDESGLDAALPAASMPWPGGVPDPAAALRYDPMRGVQRPADGPQRP
jgi:tetratricopeptide (TPR) repeat protein